MNLRYDANPAKAGYGFVRCFNWRKLVLRRKRTPLSSNRTRAILAEALEGRCLLSVSASSSLLVFNSISSGSSGAGPSPAQTLTVTNTGSSAINLGSSGLTIVDDSSVSTHDASDFSITNQGSTPATLAAGASANLSVRFTSPSAGLHSAILQINTNDATTPLVQVTLHGLGTTGTGGGNEPSLAAILRAYNIPTIVGDGANDVNAYSSTFYPNPPDASSQEVVLQRLQAANTQLPVSIQVLGTFAVSNQPAARFGYYPAGDPTDKTGLFTINQADAQTVHPTVNGITTFTPGASSFGLYANFPTFTDNGQQRVAYSEDSLNTWDASVPRKIRFFPMENPNGSVVPNAYVFTSEDYNLQYDSNDVVGIIRNVQGATGGASAPVLGLTNPQGLPFSDRLIFNRIQNQNTTFGDSVHDTNTIQINNTGSSTLTISGITLSDNTAWQLVSPPSFPAQVAAGGTLSVTVKFIATTNSSHTDNQSNTTATTNGISVVNAGGVYNGTLTISSNDPIASSRSVSLAGYWQYQSEHENEPGVQTIVNIAGYNVVTGATSNAPDLTEGSTRVTYGQEVVSPLWAAADPTLPVQVQLLATFHNQGNTSTTYWYNAGSSSLQSLIVQGSDYGQAILPNNASGGIAKGSFSPAGNFGFNLDGENSQDNLNTADINTYHRSGHAVRFYPLRDQSGNLIPNAWLILQDYQNGSFDNDDFQDMVEVAFNMRPAAQPPAPQSVSATGITGGVSVQWQPVTYSGAVTYNVYRANGINGTFTQINSSPVSGTSFVDSNAPANATSVYRVTAVSSGVESPGSNAAGAPLQAGAVTGPAAPTGFAAIGTSAAITLSWSAQSDAASFNLLRSTSANGSFVQINGSPLTTTSFTDSTAPTGVVSYYQLVAVDGSGNVSAPATANATRTGAVNTTTLTFGGKQIARYTDGSHVVILRITGPGTGTAEFINGATTPSSITLTNTTGKSVFTITSTHGATSIGDLVVNGSLNRIAALQANSTGNIVISGTLGSLQLAGAGNGRTLSIQTASRAVSLTFGNVTDLAINSAAPIALLQAKSWSVTNGNLDVIHAPSIARLVVAGQFGASLLLSGTGRDLAAASIRGGVSGGTWTIAGSVGNLITSTIAAGWSGNVAGSIGQLSTTSSFGGKLTASSVPLFHVGGTLSGATIQLSSTAATAVRSLVVGGAITNSQVRSSGGIGLVRAAALVDSNIFAGVKAGISTLPASANDFSSVARIASVLISGAHNQFALDNGNIAAANIGTVTLGAVNINNGGVKFGVAADTLQGYTRRVNGKLMVWTKKQGIAALTPDGDVVARVFSQA